MKLKTLLSILAMLLLAGIASAQDMICLNWCSPDCTQCHLNIGTYNAQYPGPQICQPCTMSPPIDQKSSGVRLTPRGIAAREKWKAGGKGKAFDHSPYLPKEIIDKMLASTCRKGGTQ